MKIAATIILIATLSTFGAHAADTPCDARAADKKLAGAAKTSFLKKCNADAGATAQASCDAQAAEKKLAGAAKASFTKKCVKNAGGAGSAPRQ